MFGAIYPGEASIKNFCEKLIWQMNLNEIAKQESEGKTEIDFSNVLTLNQILNYFKTYYIHLEYSGKNILENIDFGDFYFG